MSSTANVFVQQANNVNYYYLPYDGFSFTFCMEALQDLIPTQFPSLRDAMLASNGDTSTEYLYRDGQWLFADPDCEDEDGWSPISKWDEEGY